MLSAAARALGPPSRACGHLAAFVLEIPVAPSLTALALVLTRPVAPIQRLRR